MKRQVLGSSPRVKFGHFIVRSELQILQQNRKKKVLLAHPAALSYIIIQVDNRIS